MVRFSYAFEVSTIFTFMFSVLILRAGVWLSYQCDSFLDKPVIAVGLILMVISIAGLVGFRSWLVRMYLLVMFVLIGSLLCLTMFTFAVTNKGVGESLSGKGYKEYKIEDYGNWLQKRVNNNENWRQIKSCLQDKQVCKIMTNAERLTRIQSGCCKPSDSCNFTYVSPVNWTKTTKASPDTDCALWDNDPNMLCFNCQSCKAVMLETKKTNWIVVSIFNVISIVFLVFVYCLLCLGMIGAEEDSWSKSYP